ncbi:MAG: ABC-2 family transporter protein [Chloroflexi bacterium]|nr:ABC-2 family transporter protein [Chloroflexota bacterium]
MKRIQAELIFLRALVGVNLASAMEYRASFISQIVGMFINNGIYFVFWIIFFNQFGTIRGYNVDEIFLLFATVTLGYGLGFMFAGNTRQYMAYLVAQGRLDYYLVFPRNLLLHVIFSKMIVSTVGDVAFGLIAYSFTGRFTLVEIGLFLTTAVLAAIIFVGYSVITGSLAFYMGNAQYASQQMTNAMLTFALYPNSLFSGAARMMLYTVIPAAFVGSVPVDIVRNQDGRLLLLLVGAAILVWLIALFLFYYGLRRYESGSAINVNI